MGYKAYSDSYLMSLTKAQIIELLRIAEHNFFATEEALNNSVKAGMEIAEKYDETKRLLKLAVEDLRYLESHTVDEEGSCLISDRGERIRCFDCPFNNGGKVNEKCVWNYEVEALKLLNDEK